MLALVAVLTALLQQGPQTATIEGTVVRAGTTFPVAGVEIRVTTDSGNSVETVTDGSGRFILQGVSAGRVRIEAQADGYLFLVRLSGGATIRDPVGGVYLADGLIFPNSVHRQTVNASAGESLKLPPISATAAAAIRGRVLDREGRGISDVTLTVIAEMADSVGRRQLVTEMGTTRTDERGEYRKDMLAPGNYYLRAVVDQPGATSLTIYYPSTTDNRAAGPVVLSEGAESIADITVPETLAQTFRIAGRVLPVDGASLEAAVELMLKTQTPPTSRVADGSTSQKTGRFELRGVPTGIYDLFASARIGGRTYFEKVPVEVRSRDAENLEIVLKPSVDVKGRLVIDGDPVNLQTVRISLNRKDRLFGDVIRPAFDDVGTGFVFRDVPPGAYDIAVRFTAETARSDSYVADIRASGRSVFDGGFEVGVDATDALEVVLGAHGGSILGDVVGLNSRQPATVILAPDASSRNDASQFGAVSTDAQGQFELRGLTPGTYKIFAVPQGTALSGRAEVIGQYESRAVTVVVQKGMPVSGVQVPLLSPNP